MKTSKENEAAFRQELQALLAKWNATISLESKNRGHLSEYFINVYAEPKWDKDVNIIDQGFDFNDTFFRGE